MRLCGGRSRNGIGVGEGLQIPRYRFIPSEVTYLIIGMNVAVYAIEVMVGPDLIIDNFGLMPALVQTGKNVYSFLTSIYIHVDPFHIFFNMFALWTFGPECERQIGGRKFAVLYHIAGLVGNLLHFTIDPASFTIVVGASGAVFGIIAAFAVLFPLRPIFVFFFLPLLLPAALLAILYFLIELIYEFSGLNPYVAHWAHIGGLLAGFAFAFVYKAVSRHVKQRNKGVKIVWEG